MPTLKNIHHNPLLPDSKPFIEVKEAIAEIKGYTVYKIKSQCFYVVNNSDYVIGIAPTLRNAQERIFKNFFNWEYINYRIDKFRKLYEKQETKTINVTKELLEEVEEE